MSWSSVTDDVISAGFSTFSTVGYFTPGDISSDSTAYPVSVRVIFGQELAQYPIEDNIGIQIASSIKTADVLVQSLPVMPIAGDSIEIEGVDYTIIDTRDLYPRTMRLFLRKDLPYG